MRSVIVVDVHRGVIGEYLLQLHPRKGIYLTGLGYILVRVYKGSEPAGQSVEGLFPFSRCNGVFVLVSRR